MKPDKIIAKRKEQLLRQEKKMLENTGSSYWKETLAPARKKLASAIPDTTLDVLRKAFETGFYFVFDKGTALIEKSYCVQKQKDKYDVNRYILSKAVTKNNLKRFDRQAGKSAFTNKSLSAVEGTVLGIFGIGLPDIPIFIGVILRTIYEICLSYGFEYTPEKERIFILGIICTAIAKEDEKIEYSARTDRIGFQLDAGEELAVNLDVSIREASDKLSGSLLGAKFVQGFPLIGAVGGATNLSLIHSISRVATFKYKKRFLRRTLSISHQGK